MFFPFALPRWQKQKPVCPEMKVLQAFLALQQGLSPQMLSEEEADEIADHVESCHLCKMALADLAMIIDEPPLEFVRRTV